MKSVITFLICFFSTLPFAMSADEQIPYVIDLSAKQEIGGKPLAESIREFEEVAQQARDNGWGVTVERRSYTEYVEMIKKPGDSIGDTVVNKTKGCEEYDAQCVGRVRNRNKFLPEAFNDDFDGRLFIPAAAINFKIIIDAKDEYISRKEGDLMKNYISSRLIDLTESVQESMSSSFSEFCDYEKDHCEFWETEIFEHGAHF